MPYAVTQHGNINQRQRPTLKYLYLINLKHIKHYAMKQYILFILSLLCVTSCTEEDMRWGDVIGLSTHEVTLNGAGEPVTVNTKGKVGG